MDNTTRRSSIVKATVLVGALAMTKATLAASADTDLISRMTWFNEPASSKRVGEKLIVRSRPKPTSGARHFMFPASTAEVGIMCAAPEGAGFDAEFDHLSLSLLKK